MEKKKAAYHNYLGIQYSMMVKTVLLNINFSLSHVDYFFYFLASYLSLLLLLLEGSTMYLAEYHMHRTSRIIVSNNYNGQQDNINE